MSLVGALRFCPKVCGRSSLTELGSLPSTQARWSANAWLVSSHGRVQSSTGNVGNGSPAGGYRSVTIEKKRYFVHRLVAATFIGPATAERWQVNHIDRDRSNNHVTNLEYLSRAENIRHSFSHNSDRKRPETRQGKAVEWRLLGESKWSLCSTQAEAASKLGVSDKCISSCCLGKQEHAFGSGIGYEIRHANLKPEVQAYEHWKSAVIPGSTCRIPDLMVSNHGRVWSKSCRHSYITHGSCNSFGYRVVTKAGRKHYVHRLVAAAFLGHPLLPELEVNHIDSDRTNNHLQNLEYVTRSQNVRHSYSQGRTRRGCPKPVQARMLMPVGAWLDFESIRAASLHTGLSPRKISRLCNGLATGGASWEFRRKEAEKLEGEEWRPVVLEGVGTPMK